MLFEKPLGPAPVLDSVLHPKSPQGNKMGNRSRGSKTAPE